MHRMPLWLFVVFMQFAAGAAAAPASRSPELPPGYRLLSDLVMLLGRGGREAVDPAALGTSRVELLKRLNATRDAKRVDPPFAIRYSRLLSAVRQAVTSDPGLLYWPMDRFSMIDFVEERTSQVPEWDRLLFVVNDHGGSGVGLGTIVEAVLSEVVSLHIHLETLERRPVILQTDLAKAQELSGQRGADALALDTRSPERMAPVAALKRQAVLLGNAFTRHVHRNAQGEQMPYRLYTPRGIEPGRTYPLVVFLHGAGGSGTDNTRQLQGANVFGALIWTLPEHQARHPAFVLAPQSDVNWACTIFDPKTPPKTPADLTFCPPGDLGIGARLAFEIVDRMVSTQPIDPARIYVTGHSMGGAGTWHMIAQRPRMFAAAVPVSGHPLTATANIVKDLPIWNFHGEDDAIEPVATSRAMIEAIRRAGGRPRHTEYKGIGHDVYMWAYTEPALIDWVFAQRR